MSAGVLLLRPRFQRSQKSTRDTQKGESPRFYFGMSGTPPLHSLPARVYSSVKIPRFYFSLSIRPRPMSAPRLFFRLRPPPPVVVSCSAGVSVLPRFYFSLSFRPRPNFTAFLLFVIISPASPAVPLRYLPAPCSLPPALSAFLPREGGRLQSHKKKLPQKCGRKGRIDENYLKCRYQCGKPSQNRH